MPQVSEVKHCADASGSVGVSPAAYRENIYLPFAMFLIALYTDRRRDTCAPSGYKRQVLYLCCKFFNQKVSFMEEKDLFRGITEGYTVCFLDGCPKADTCTRRVAFNQMNTIILLEAERATIGCSGARSIWLKNSRRRLWNISSRGDMWIPVSFTDISRSIMHDCQFAWDLLIVSKRTFGSWQKNSHHLA